MTKNRYDTSIIMLYLLNQEKVLPKEFRKKIPYSTISSWRKVDYTSYIGHEFRYLFDDNWDVVNLKAKNRELTKLLTVVYRSWAQLRSEHFKLSSLAKKDRALQKTAVEIVSELRPLIGLTNALKALKLHRTQYHEWNIISKLSCNESITSLCVKKHPQQLSKKEVYKMEQMLRSNKFLHWPIVSIAGHGVRKGSVVASLYAWYKYARILNLSHKPEKRAKKQKGIVSSRPNEYFHIDTTYYYIGDGKKVCITFVMDNFSKMILGYALSEKLSFSLISEAINEALRKLGAREKKEQIFLIADGGKENNNYQVDALIADISVCTLSKLVALRDIQFSNSPIEAIHKIIKGRYLRNKKFETIEGLESFLRLAVEDYNCLRPHYKHAPRTPYEVYNGVDLNFDVKERMKKAANKRMDANRQNSCEPCTQTSCDKPCLSALEMATPTLS